MARGDINLIIGPAQQGRAKKEDGKRDDYEHLEDGIGFQIDAYPLYPRYNKDC